MASSSSPPSSSSSAETTPAKITWAINNFANYETGYWDSNRFATSDSQHRFKLRCYAKISLHHTDDYVLICLLRTDQPTGAIHVAYKLSILNSKGEKFFTKEIQTYFEEETKANPVYGGMYTIRRELVSEASQFITEKRLTVFCELQIIPEAKKATSETEKIIADISSLFETGKFSDAVIAIGEREFRVHKTILAIRSPVFAAMFENDCEEARSNLVRITDVDVEVFEQLLKYIYSGKVPPLKQLAGELFVAADKYQFESLKEACGQTLGRSLTIDSAANLLQLADMHNSLELKLKCIDFITNNPVDVIATEGWKQLVKQRPDLLSETFNCLSTKADPFLKGKNVN